MKANRKFLRGDDDAVSPVIAVILMVAITVVLAATVYVWVSGFGSQSSQPAKTISLTSNGAIASSVKQYAVASGTPGMKWSDLTFTLDGTSLAYNGSLGGNNEFCIADGGSTCTAGTTVPTTTIDAGDLIKIQHAALSGKTLRVLDSQANSVILTLVVG